MNPRQSLFFHRNPYDVGRTAPLLLFPYKNHLQTVALICDEHQRAELESLLLKTGVVRLTDGWNMSQNYCEMPHDGEFALRRYMKRVSIEYIAS
jgi:hypothetical protein